MSCSATALELLFVKRMGVLSPSPDPTCPLSQAEDVGKTALCLLTDLTSGVTGSGFVILYCRSVDGQHNVRKDHVI